jgi:AcrR family transcriptional regulator
VVTRLTAVHDRRAKRTRVRLEDGLLALFAERGYERTSVRALALRAAVGKSTFYEHFRDKNAVLESRLARLAGALGRAADDSGVVFAFIEPLLAHVGAHHGLGARLGRSSAGALVLARFRRLVRAFVEGELARMYPGAQAESLAFATEHVAGGLDALLEAQGRRTRPRAPAAVALDFRRLVLPGLDAWLGRTPDDREASVRKRGFETQ